MSDSYEVLGDFLQRHAYENVWCTPDQDQQVIFKPARLTRVGGAWKNITVAWRRHVLPESRARFHVYQIGQIHPTLVGLTNRDNEWILMADACNSESLITDVYTSSGIQLHRTQVWYRVTQEKNLILAVKIPDNNRIPVDLDNEELFIRLYSNAYYNSIRADDADDVVHVEGGFMTTSQQILDLQAQMIVWQNKGVGHVYAFVNGFRTKTIDPLSVSVGDYAEFVFDGSIKRVVTFSIGSLPQFTSTMDSMSKYLLHYSAEEDQIDYQDDLDLFLVKSEVGGRFKGVYVHKNNEKALRMVTHKDYSVPVQFLTAYLAMRDELGEDLSALQLVMHIRESGHERDLVNEHNRIQELYRLSDAEVLEAMVGVNSNVSVWTADALESSGYCALMRKKLGEVGRLTVQQAYGYNAISQLLGDTPRHTTTASGNQVVTVPVGLVANSTAYEHDANGYLLGSYVHASRGTNYTCVNASASLVEMLYGEKSNGLEAWWDVMTHTIDPQYSYRFYTCGITVGGQIDNIWVDVTDTPQYGITNNVVQWLTNPATTHTLVRSNKKHVVESFDSYPIDGLITFSLREWRTDILAYQAMRIPLGSIDVWVNGKSCIEGLDYFVEYPRVTIVNKEFLITPNDGVGQHIVVRQTGFCNSDLEREEVADVGFVRYGVLSKNNRYDVREDKVNRIVIEGALYRHDELEYAEGDFQVRVVDARNGAPYMIKNVIVPMNNYLTSGNQDPTYTLKTAAALVDEEVSDYLTLKIPEKDPDEPSSIANRYQVVSPFFCKIIYDLSSGALWHDQMFDHYSDQFVQEQVEFYEYLLAWDPINPLNRPSSDFVVIHPHNVNAYVTLGVYQYKFLDRVMKLYGDGLIDLSGSINVASFG